MIQWATKERFGKAQLQFRQKNRRLKNCSLFRNWIRNVHGQQLINLPVKAIGLTYAQSDLISDSLAPITSLRQTNEHQ